ncbi:hypothetical protein C5C36_01105 [Rathayibacter sp. AY1G1]|uniref:hypothetical protein n=1 Tax=Rathayibacter sp. AY1G1 TaxID=2080564 RepID=UPI000CE85A0D|nr:hypothetical protein [Rathayibacter sp. AY1G1]PPH15914.1 hypothetical protein C5C36_01105 [Rathayibacter sp. AY1G1]
MSRGGRTLLRARALLPEVLAGAVVAAATLAAIGLLLGTEWQSYFLRDGDSLALPLILRSLGSGGPHQWVMTSQLFLFPELPLYALASLVGDAAAALLLNGVLNVVLLYATARWISGLVLAHQPAWLRRTAAVLSILLLLALCLTETRALVNEGALATTFLLTTYYGGSVLVAAVCAALTLNLLRPGGRLPVWSGLAMVLLLAATTLSDPLLMLHFTAPAVLALGSLWLTAQLAGRRVLGIGALVIAGTAIGYLARLPLSSLIATGTSSYLKTTLAGTALTALLDQLTDIMSTRAGLLELVTIGLLLAAALVVVGVRIRALATGPREPGTGDERRPARAWFLCVLVLGQALVLLTVQIVSGSIVSRYLMPIAVFACLVPIAVLALPRVLPGLGRAASIVSAVAAGTAVVLLAVFGIRTVSSTLRAGVLQQPESQCVTDWVGGRDIAGVGSFWTTRPLSLYAGLDVEQINTDFSIQVWMSDLTRFERHFSFVLIDRDTQWPDFAQVTLGKPASITACGSVLVYDYAGTPGEQRLDEIIDTSLERERGIHGY